MTIKKALAELSVFALILLTITLCALSTWSCSNTEATVISNGDEEFLAEDERSAEDEQAYEAEPADEAEAVDFAEIFDELADDDGETESDDAFEETPDAEPYDEEKIETERPESEPEVDLDGSKLIIAAQDALISSALKYGQYKSGLGFDVDVFKASEISTAGEAQFLTALKSKVKRAVSDSQTGKLVYLLIIGDSYDGRESVDNEVPAQNFYNSHGECYTDNSYVDIDGDGLPEAAVGRLPFRTNAEVEAYLEKLKKYDSGYETGLWNRRITFYAGEAGFGAQVDGIIEYLAFNALDRMNYSFDLIGAWDNPASPYYYIPFPEKVADLYNMGSLMNVFIGHGSKDGTNVDFSASDMSAINVKHKIPFSFFFACQIGMFKGKDDSLSEAMIKAVNSPLTALGASDDSHPYANAVYSYEIQRAMFDAFPATIGGAVMTMKREGSLNKNDKFRGLMNNLAKQTELTEEDFEPLLKLHASMYNLLGDPSIEVKYPKTDLWFDWISGSVNKGKIAVAGTVGSVKNGTVYVTLEVRRSVINFELNDVPDYPDYSYKDAVNENWKLANDKKVAEVYAQVKDGAFEAELNFGGYNPEDEYYIKAYAEDGANDAFANVRAPYRD